MLRGCALLHIQLRMLWASKKREPTHATLRSPSIRLSHSPIWFQLVKIRLTIKRSKQLRGSVIRRR